MKKIAVIGGGIFGVTAAIKLTESGFDVSLYEKNKDIMMAASGINQYRLHSGYHYPRSKDTISSCIDSLSSFKQEYGEALINDVNHYYCIAKEGSLTSGDDFISVCKENGLKYEIAELEIVNKDSVSLCIKAEESLIDINKLKSICKKRIKDLNIKVFLGKEVKREDLNDYDFVIIATYANLNEVLEENNMKGLGRDYQFELCEKPVVKLPENFKNKSVVVMDGPFMCIDPLGDTELFVMGNVVHAIHQTNIGETPVIDEKFKNLLNNGIVTSPSITNFDKFIESAKKFIPEIDRAEHVGSMYTIRTVLPKLDKTDDRPTIVNKINKKTITIFSGKIGNCVQSANQVVKLVKNEFDS